MLHKCKTWNFDARVCMGEWVNIMNVTPGQYYTIDFDPTDPAYGEGSDDFTLTSITIDGNFSVDLGGRDKLNPNKCYP